MIFLNILKEILKLQELQIPKLYATENEDNPLVKVRLSYPDFHWTWYVIEYDGDDTCFGLVDGDELEMGYFTISELDEAWGQQPLTIQTCAKGIRLDAIKKLIKKS